MDLDMNDHSESEDTNGDGEGVWSPDIEQCFREALLLFPPCGRRKHILQEEGGGKMYGRNELIARHIMMRTGKKRTRKQVSSHIQVLARRKAKAEAASTSASSTISNLTSSNSSRTQSHESAREELASQHLTRSNSYLDVWSDRAIVTQKIRLVEFSAFIEYRDHFHSASLPLGSPTLDEPQATGELTSSLYQQDLGASQLPSQHQQMHSPYQRNQRQPPAATNPLASNHQLHAQFNQATYQSNNHQIHQLQPQKSSLACAITNNQNIPANQSSSGFTRHSYVHIDYSQTSGRQVNKLEKIEISQIQDKYPEIGGPDGLFQRGPSDAFFLVKFWADLNNDYEYNIEDQNSFFGFTSRFETADAYKDITCSTKVSSYGRQVVEKVEKIYGAFNGSNGRYSYDINRSPMCEFVTSFIKKLRPLPTISLMNNVLENFSVLQVVTSESTSEILLCLAYAFAIASPEQNQGPQYRVYKLAKD